MKTKFFRKNRSTDNGNRKTANVTANVGTRLIASLPHRLIASQRAQNFAPIRAICILFLLCPVVVSAQTGNGVTVSNLAVNAGTVTFNVAWDRDAMPVSVWSDTVWVFVDYNHNGTMERLPLLPGATLTTTSVPGIGSVKYAENNNQGVWVIGNAKTASSGSFSATVQLLTTIKDVAGACAYASNYPPVGEYISATKISFTGTPMYKIVLEETAGGTTFTAYSDGSYTLPAGQNIQSFTDVTGAPGIMKCMPPATYTLQASALEFCAGLVNVQFALSGTEDGRKYQLFRNDLEVGAILNGTGSAATFTGSFNTAGTYTAQTVADELYCATAMDGTRAVIENPLPANPTVFGASRNCSGTVTLSASSSGAVIDWYADAAGTNTLHTGASYTTPEIETNTSYYVQARVESTGCMSAARVPVLAEVVTEGCCTTPGSTVTFEEFNPCATAATGDVWYLTDTREAAYNNTQTYKVKKLSDGHIWMVQDLKFGDKCKRTTFTGTTSNVTDRVSSLTDKTYYGDCTNARQSNTSSKRGFMYDWAAAINKRDAYAKHQNSSFGCSGTASGKSSNNPAACQGICPNGWHVPTGDTSGEYANLCTTYNANLTNCVTAVFLSLSVYEGVQSSPVQPGGEFINGCYYYYTSTSGNYCHHIGCHTEGLSLCQWPCHEAYRARVVRCVMNY